MSLSTYIVPLNKYILSQYVNSTHAYSLDNTPIKWAQPLSVQCERTLDCGPSTQGFCSGCAEPQNVPQHVLLHLVMLYLITFTNGFICGSQNSSLSQLAYTMTLNTQASISCTPLKFMKEASDHQILTTSRWWKDLDEVLCGNETNREYNWVERSAEKSKFILWVEL